MGTTATSDIYGRSLTSQVPQQKTAGAASGKLPEVSTSVGGSGAFSWFAFVVALVAIRVVYELTPGGA